MSLVHKDGVHQAAFRCKHCGHLVHSGHAGELTHPRLCPVCKAGTVFGHSVEECVTKRSDALGNLTPEQLKARTTEIQMAPGVKLVHVHIPEDWEVLADCPPARLAELGLAPEHICTHVPFKGSAPTDHQPTHHDRSAVEGIGTTDVAK